MMKINVLSPWHKVLFPWSVLIAFLSIMPMKAQQRLFTLEDLNFGGTNYINLRPKNLQLEWWGDKLVHTDVEECYVVDPKTGKEKLLFTLDDINRWAESDDLYHVRHLQNATFLYPDKPVVAVGNKRAFLLVDFKAGKVIWQDSISGQTANTWNAKSRATAFIDDNQLCVVDGDGQRSQLTTDGSREIVYGQAVHRNEFGIEGGLFWSPDGQRLAFYRMDQSMVTDYPQVDVFTREAAHQPDKYPMAGMATHRVTVGVYDLHTRKVVYLQTPDSPTDPDSALSPVPVYFTNISFSPDGSTVYMFELNRDQNDCRLVSYDAATGRRKAELIRETSDKYVEPLNPIRFLPWDNGKFIVQSQRDGYNHLYLYDTEGTLISQLTAGPWVVLDVLGFCPRLKSVIIKSNELHPLQTNLFAVDIATGRRTLLGSDQGVVQSAALSDTGSRLYVRYATPDAPRLIDIVTLPSSVKGQAGKPVRLLTAPDPWSDFQQPLFECGTLKAADDTTDLYWRMVKPASFDPQQKYPTVVYVYGGPHAHCVDRSWHYASRSWETYMAQKGYIVFILDNRGSENRGRDFEQATFRQLGQIEMADQMRGVSFLQSLPYVDRQRIGVHGWSFGGFMTISLMLNHPDVFRVGVAGGPVIDWSLYEVMYGERYMDTPGQNPEGYDKTSLLNKAGQLKGKLQIITGYNDPTVVPQHCLRFLDACVKAGTQPDFFAYPGEGHNMMGHASVHLHERITQYFEDYLK